MINPVYVIGACLPLVFVFTLVFFVYAKATQHEARMSFETECRDNGGVPYKGECFFP